MENKVRRIVHIGLGVLGALLALTLACAPAAEQKAPAPAAEKPAAQQPAAQQPAAQPKPAEQKPAPAVQQPAAEKPAAPKATLPPGEEAAKFGGVLLVGAQRDPLSFLDWQESLDVDTEPVRNGLLQWRDWGLDLNCKDCNAIVGDLAQSWEWGKDGLSFTLRLVDGAKWHDGQPFTCADAAWGIDVIRTGQGMRRSPRALQFRAVTAAECADARTLVLRLKQPQPSLLYGLAQSGNVMLPKHLYASDIKRAADKTSIPIGTGPFLFKEYIPNEKVGYTRNPDYWNKPYPYLDGQEVRILGTLTAIRTALRGGRVHLDRGPAYMTGAAIPTLIKECAHCVAMARGDVPSFQFMMVNHQRPPWNTPEVKDALSYAIDRVKFTNVASDGWFVPTGILSPGGDGFWSLDKEPWFRQVPGFNFEDPEGNKAKARELLAKAGYKPGELTVDFWTNKGFIPMVTLGEDLNAVGIKATFREVEAAPAYEAAGAGDFNLIAWSSGMGSRDPDTIFFDTYYTGTDRNYGRYSNPEADRLMDLQSRTLDPQERRRVAFRAAEVMMKDMATIPLGWRMTQPVFSQDVRNWLPVYCGLCSRSARFERVWLERK